MNNEQRMQAGLLYNPSDPALSALQTEALEDLYDFNVTRPSEGERRTELLKRMLASIGEGCYIEPPFHANWGGRHVHFGDHVYANFNLTVVDDGEIYVGDRVMFGPNVTISTAGHPVLPELRTRAAQFNLPVLIGNNVWIGAGALIMPGITIGDNTVIGAGSVVTRDIPADVVAVGNPCRVLRTIGDHDREFYWRDRRIDITADEL
ncbi:MAG: sugar O-acetyltransferase [Propioniciclava sp.]|uniref:sugar O-acetyltransferase n=1 Tax=Propioniciclava sp. TaxID=2038686 RepID=UPI0039E6D3E6